MDLTLTRYDVLTVAALNPRSMKVLPTRHQSSTQKIAVGDTIGTLQCFTYRGGQIQSVFKAAIGGSITGVQLGNLAGEMRNRVYATSGTRAFGYLKNGTRFFEFDTNLAENIRSFSVETPKLWAVGEYSVTGFHETKEFADFIAGDVVNDITVFFDRKLVVLGCQDRMIRLLSMNLEAEIEIPVEGPVTRLSPYYVSSSKDDVEAASRRPDGILYGTQNGIVGFLQLVEGEADMVKAWVIRPDTAKAGVSALSSYDMTRDGHSDVLVGRDDGQVEIYSTDFGPERGPVLIFERCLNESITEVCAGRIVTTTHPDVLVSTYSGKIVCFSSAPSASVVEAEETSTVTQKLKRKLTIRNPKAITKESTGAKEIRTLEKEIEQLQVQLADKKKRYAHVCGQMAAVTHEYHVNDKLFLNSDGSGTYTLSIELSIPIQSVVMKCDAPVNIMDVESNRAIISRTPVAEDSKDKVRMLASYRCQEKTNRLEARIQTVEGQSGNLAVVVNPALEPRIATSLQYEIKPLSLHVRRPLLTDEDRVPLSRLTISGSFVLAQVHAWVMSCIPEVPTKIVDSDEVHLSFECSFQGSVLDCRYKKGEAVFYSNSASTLAILKNRILQQATQRRITVGTVFDHKVENDIVILKALYPMWKKQLKLTKQARFVPGLKELKMQESDLSYLCDEYNQILRHADKIDKEHKKAPNRLQYLTDLVVRLYRDSADIRGMGVDEQEVQKLLSVLSDFDRKEVFEFFLTHVK